MNKITEEREDVTAGTTETQSIRGPLRAAPLFLEEMDKSLERRNLLTLDLKKQRILRDT